MADPISLGMVGISAGSALLGGINSAQGAAAQGASQQAMYNYKAGVALINKQIADQNADYAIKVGESQAQATGIAGRTAVGSQRAVASGSGLDVGSGSKASVIESTQMVAEQNQATVRADAARRAYGYEVQGAQDVAQAGLDTAAGEDAKAASSYKVAGSILGTASSVASKWSTASQAFGSGASPSRGDDFMLHFSGD